MSVVGKSISEELVEPDIRVRFADSKLSAIISVRGRVESRISLTQIEAILKEHGVRYGVDLKEVQKLLNQFFASQERIAFISGEVARGIPPKPGIPGKLDFMIQHTDKVKIDRSGKADFRNIEKFHTVLQGDVLVKRTKAIPGTEGMTVTSDVIKPEEVTDPHLGTGMNIMYDEPTGEYRAAVEGIFYFSDGKISVNPVLEIHQNVGLETGNIRYKGDIAVYGEVESGSQVNAGKSLKISGNLEASGIEVGSELNVKGGIIADQTQPIVVGGDLLTNFIEHSILDIAGDLRIRKSVVQSKVVCGGSVQMPYRNSVILGGSVYCFGSLEVDEIGNKAEVKTIVELGCNYNIREKITELNAELQNLIKEIQKLNVKVEQVKLFLARKKTDVDPEKMAQIKSLFETYKKRSHQMKSLENEIHELKNRMFNPDVVQLLVHNTIHAGVDVLFFGFTRRILQPTGPILWKFKRGSADPEVHTYTGRN